MKLVLLNSRDKQTGEKEFLVEYNDGTIVKKTFTNLICCDKFEFVSHFEILPILEQHMTIASNTPSYKRKCWCCNNDTIEGTIFCKKHKDYQLFIENLKQNS